MTYSRYGWNNTGSLVTFDLYIVACSKQFMQQTHTVFGELAHYGSEPFKFNLI